MALSLRVTADLKKRLEQNAELNGRSLSQEAEFRLEHTFDRQGLLLEVLKLAFGVGWAGFIIFNGSRFKQLNEDAAGQLRKILEKAILSFDPEKHYLSLAARAAREKERKGKRR